MPPDTRRPMRILRLIARLNIGGPATHAILLTTGLPTEAYDSVLVTGVPEPLEGDQGNGSDAAAVRRIVIPCLGRALNPWRDSRAWWTIFRLICQEQPDLVHTHTAKAGALGRSAVFVYNRLQRLRSLATHAPRRTCRTVHTFHGHVLDGYFGRATTAVFLAIERVLARSTDRIIAVSSTLRDDLLRLKIGRQGQVVVIPLGLPLDALLALPPSEQRPTQLRVGMVGRLVPIKNHQLFLQVAKACREDPVLSSLQFVIVGDGELRNTLERAAQRLGLDGSLTFTGWRSDMATIYQGLDIVCLTSLNEGTPVCLIEALASSRAVIATDVGGVRDLLGPTSADSGLFKRAAHGLLVQSCDAEGLREGLRYLACRFEERRAMGEAGRAFVRERYSSDRLIRDIVGLYQEVAA